MKIKFLKDFVAAQSNDYSDMHAIFIERGDIVDVDGCKYNGRYFDMPKAQAQWLIDNGFAEEVKESGWWKPKYDEKYFYIGHDGFVYSCTWKNDELDNGRLELGLVFKTKEAGTRCCDYLKAIATVRQDEGVLAPKQINELIKNEDLAHYVGYMGNRSNGEVLCGCTMSFEDCWMPLGVILFDTEEHADASCEKHQDEWKVIANYDWSRE